MNCAFCGKELVQEHYNQKYHKECLKKLAVKRTYEWRKKNIERWHKYMRESARKKRALNPRKITCIVCGKKVITRRIKTCSVECFAIHRSRRASIWQKNNPERYRELHRKAAYKYWYKKRYGLTATLPENSTIPPNKPFLPSPAGLEKREVKRV